MKLIIVRGEAVKVRIDLETDLKETQVLIRCRQIDEDVDRLVKFIETPHHKVLGEIDKEWFIIEPEKIYYIEAVDNKIFIYGTDQVYESRKRLYEFEALLEKKQFFRASKSMILNIGKISSVKPLFDGRFEATLKNKEKVYISRKYVAELKIKLGL